MMTNAAPAAAGELRVLKPLYERVAARCNRGGLPVGAQAVREIDRLLAEERRAARLGRAV